MPIVTDDLMTGVAPARIIATTVAIIHHHAATPGRTIDAIRKRTAETIAERTGQFHGPMTDAGQLLIAVMTVDRPVRPRVPLIAVARRQQFVMIVELALRVLMTGEARGPIDDSIDLRRVLTIAAGRLGWRIEIDVARKAHHRDSNRDDPTIAISVGSAGPTSNVTTVEDHARNGVIRVAEAALPADRNEDSTLVGHADTAVKPSASALVVNSAEEAQQWGEVASTTEAAQAPIVVRGHSAIADQQCTAALDAVRLPIDILVHRAISPAHGVRPSAALNTTGSVLRTAKRAGLPCRAEGIDSFAEWVQRSDTHLR